MSLDFSHTWSLDFFKGHEIRRGLFEGTSEKKEGDKKG
jgi:hypothetical protein